MRCQNTGEGGTTRGALVSHVWMATHWIWNGIEGKKPENQQIVFSDKENIYGFLGRFSNI